MNRSRKVKLIDKDETVWNWNGMKIVYRKG